jgi:hypothetical protein
MKRLFTLRTQSGGLFTGFGHAVYFDLKPLAKASRDQLNRNIPEHAKLRVSIGPDHDGYKGRPHARRSRFKSLRDTR